MRRDRIYRVAFEERYRGEGTWQKKELDVLANGEVLKAIAAAKKDCLSQFYEDDKGKHVPCVGFRLVSVNTLATADIEG